MTDDNESRTNPNDVRVRNMQIQRGAETRIAALEDMLRREREFHDRNSEFEAEIHLLNKERNKVIGEYNNLLNEQRRATTEQEKAESEQTEIGLELKIAYEHYESTVFAHIKKATDKVGPHGINLFFRAIDEENISSQNFPVTLERAKQDYIRLGDCLEKHCKLLSSGATLLTENEQNFRSLDISVDQEPDEEQHVRRIGLPKEEQKNASSFVKTLYDRFATAKEEVVKIVEYLNATTPKVSELVERYCKLEKVIESTGKIIGDFEANIAEKRSEQKRIETRQERINDKQTELGDTYEEGKALAERNLVKALELPSEHKPRALGSDDPYDNLANDKKPKRDSDPMLEMIIGDPNGEDSMIARLKTDGLGDIDEPFPDADKTDHGFPQGISGNRDLSRSRPGEVFETDQKQYTQEEIDIVISKVESLINKNMKKAYGRYLEKRAEEPASFCSSSIEELGKIKKIRQQVEESTRTLLEEHLREEGKESLIRGIGSDLDFDIWSRAHSECDIYVINPKKFLFTALLIARANMKFTDELANSTPAQYSSVDVYEFDAVAAQDKLYVITKKILDMYNPGLDVEILGQMDDEDRKVASSIAKNRVELTPESFENTQADDELSKMYYERNLAIGHKNYVNLAQVLAQGAHTETVHSAFNDLQVIKQEDGTLASAEVERTNLSPTADTIRRSYEIILNARVMYELDKSLSDERTKLIQIAGHRILPQRIADSIWNEWVEFGALTGEMKNTEDTPYNI